MGISIMAGLTVSRCSCVRSLASRECPSHDTYSIPSLAQPVRRARTGFYGSVRVAPEVCLPLPRKQARGARRLLPSAGGAAHRVEASDRTGSSRFFHHGEDLLHDQLGLVEIEPRRRRGPKGLPKASARSGNSPTRVTVFRGSHQLRVNWKSVVAWLREVRAWSQPAGVEIHQRP